MHSADIWTDARLDDIVDWLQQAYPDEGCGLILEDAEGQARWMRCENLADKYHQADPETYPRTAKTFYMINPMEFVRAERRGEQVGVIVHSHADVGDYFSDEDIAGATLPRDSEDAPLEPTYPGVDYLVVSVREGRADHATLFRFSPHNERGFEAALYIDIDDGHYVISASSPLAALT